MRMAKDDEVGEDETHPLASMMEILGVLIENYETNCGLFTSDFRIVFVNYSANVYLLHH